MLVSGLALVLACAGFFAYDQVTFRQALVHTLSAQAQIIASNTVSALLFNDPQSASKTLEALKSSPNIASAGIATMDRRPFAHYGRDPGGEILHLQPLAEGEIEKTWFAAKHVVLIRLILSENRPIGLVYLRADLSEIDRRLRRYAAIAVVVLVISLLAAMLISSGFRKSVAQPIIQLAETARVVSRDRNYSVRAAPTGEQDELAILIASFNEMLEEIQARESALQKAHDELERRVSERTRDLVAANRELEAFSYSVSHDLRGPLDAINGFSYVLLKRYGEGLDHGARELIEDIRLSGKRMMELVDDLLNLSRVTTSVLHPVKIDLSAIARSVAEELCRVEPARRVEFDIAETPLAKGDGRLLRIVLENLLRNSWKYTSNHPRARIEFASSNKNGQPTYFVRDDGVGFDPRAAGRLFQPFQRLHSIAEFPGNGIGLATVQRIIRRHRGEIWAEGKQEQGATFFFTIGLPDKGAFLEPAVQPTRSSTALE